ncbi:hypothetical protein K1719_018869 [Acacia pycnantha]|nr:hypothetical protein K1719_018869 [Acacia pycnantha]
MEKMKILGKKETCGSYSAQHELEKYSSFEENENSKEEDRRGWATKARSLIEKATNSTSGGVDPRLLRAVKSVVRNSDSELRIAAETLTDLMKRDRSQVPQLTLLISDELFMRSKLFRTLLVENLDQLLSLSIGFRQNHPLPGPRYCKLFYVQKPLNS